MAVTYTIHAGSHRAKPLTFGLWWNKKVISMDVLFHADCFYDLPMPDMMDTNKLFGIGYFPGHHKNSARFGWRYDYQFQKIVLVAYCYDNGKRYIEELCAVPLGKWIHCELQVWTKGYFFDVSNGVPLKQLVMPKTHRKKLSYKLGPYFGGNKDAPRTMNIQMEKL